MERIPVAGGHLEGEAVGSGDPVLLIHGAIIDDAYDPFRTEPAVAARHRLIYYRRRGFSGSVKHSGPFSIAQQAADARAVLAHFGVERAHIVGHSYGGCIALQLALDDPAAVHTLGLLEPVITHVPAAIETAEGLVALVALWQSGDKAAATDAFAQAVAGPDYRATLDKTLLPGWFDRAVADIDHFFAVELPALDEWSFAAAEAGRVAQPSLVVAGAASTEADQQGAAWLREHLPQAEAYTLADATHLLQMCNPTPLAAALAAFFARRPIP
ncbi:MAG: alpha/beta fold hydrolase [Acidimicrobiales bacterium]